MNNNNNNARTLFMNSKYNQLNITSTTSQLKTKLQKNPQVKCYS